MGTQKEFISALIDLTGKSRVLTSARRMRYFCTGIRVGGGTACAVVLPNTLLQLWQVLKVCVDHEKIVIVQAANTGLTGGSTPCGNDYDRDVVIINTLNIDKLILINQGH